MCFRLRNDLYFVGWGIESYSLTDKIVIGKFTLMMRGKHHRPIGSTLLEDPTKFCQSEKVASVNFYPMSSYV